MGDYPFSAPAAGLSNPMTTLGDLIDGGASGVPQRIAIGPSGDVLTVVGGVPAWAAATGGAPGLRLVYVDNFAGVDPTGATDSTAGINLAIAALGASPGNLVFGVGTYKWGTSADLTALQQNQGIVGQGSQVTFFNYVGSATAIPLVLSGAFTGAQFGGKFTGFQLSGFGASGSAVGFKAGNLQGIWMDDVQIGGFPGAGIELQNAAAQWAEQGTFRVRLIQNKIAVLCDTGSFDYSNFDLTIEALASQSGLVVQNGAALQGVDLRMRGNFAGGAGNTGAVIAVAPAGGADTAFIKGTQVDVAVETTGTGTGHFTIQNNSTTGASQIFTQGTLFFANIGGVNFQGVSSGQPFSHIGVLSDTVYGILQNGEAGVIVGGLGFYPLGNLTTALFSSDLFTEAGDILSFQLINGNNPLSFQSTSAYARRIDLYMAQPASGAAGTVTWTGVKWAAATPPTLSAVNGFVDHVRMTWLPAQGFWYGELVGVHYA
jgi:hypothetical protein